MAENYIKDPSRGILPDMEPVWGIRGTARYGMVSGSTAQNLYVDRGHANASDNNDGTDPRAPKATVQSAFNSAFLEEHSTIFVAGDVAEAAVTTDATTGPNNVEIVGVGGANSPIWASGAAAANCLDIRATGYVVSGFNFTAPSAAAAIRVSSLPGSNWNAYQSVIHDCKFDGYWSGLYGIEFWGAPHRIEIINNHFLEMRQAGAGVGYAIFITDTTDTNPYECIVAGNRFTECEGHISSLGGIRGFNVSVFKGNIFEAGVLIPTTIYLDLRGGSRGENIVFGNFFGGDYSNTGGYYAHAANPGSWVGNIAEDVVEAEVGDNGFTIAPPAA